MSNIILNIESASSTNLIVQDGLNLVLASPTVFTVELGGPLVGIDGKSAYQIAVLNGFVGTEPEWVASLALGPQGPQGVPGVSGASFIYEQAVPSTSWLITHNLDRFPSVFVVDSANSVVEGDTQYIDANTVSLNFLSAFSGKAFLN